jgi:hypothetical protein
MHTELAKKPRLRYQATAAHQLLTRLINASSRSVSAADHTMISMPTTPTIIAAIAGPTPSALIQAKRGIIQSSKPCPSSSTSISNKLLYCPLMRLPCISVRATAINPPAGVSCDVAGCSFCANVESCPGKSSSGLVAKNIQSTWCPGRLSTGLCRNYRLDWLLLEISQTG